MTPRIYMNEAGELSTAGLYEVELEPGTDRRLRRVAGRMDLTPEGALMEVIEAGLVALAGGRAGGGEMPDERPECRPTAAELAAWGRLRRDLSRGAADARRPS